MLIVSHDRDFLDRTVTVTLGLDGSGTVDIVAGGYEDWEAKRSKRTPPPKKPARTESAPPPPSPAPSKPAKLSYKDQRDYELLPARIEELDAAIARSEATLADPDLFTHDSRQFDRVMKVLEAARAEKAAAEERWLALAELAES